AHGAVQGLGQRPGPGHGPGDPAHGPRRRRVHGQVGELGHRPPHLLLRRRPRLGPGVAPPASPPAANVYDWCMARVRTNIEIEDSYVQVIMRRYGLRTKTDAVELALRLLAGQPMTREEALAMRGANAIG